MRTLWVCHPNLNSLSVHDTLHTALTLAYPDAPKITIVPPKHLDFQPHSVNEMLQQIYREVQRHNIQRILISMFPQDIETATALILRCGETYATTVSIFDYPFFLPENAPTIEAWLRQSWRHAVVKDTMVGLIQCWEVVSTQQRQFQRDSTRPYARNLIEF